MTARTARPLLTALALATFLTACATYRMDAAEHLAEEELAVLTMSFPRLLPEIFVTHIDCVSPGFTSPKSFQLAPGWRAITLQGNPDLGMAPDPKTYLVQLLPGRAYTYLPDPNNSTNTWLLAFVDDAADRRIQAGVMPAGMNLLTGARPNPEACELVAELNRTGARELPDWVRR
ncbi:hypothetical protein [Halomonas denitrificans]|nr:hypothetical protein [Halomonas denitrificans]